jgi:ATP-binding cassette subfamily B protein
MKDIAFCLRFLLRLSWRTDRLRLSLGGLLLLLGFLATPLVALELRGIVDAVLDHQGSTASLWSVVAAVTLIAELMLGHFAHLSYFELGELNEERLGREILRLVNGTRGLEQCDDPAFADGIDLLRQDIVRMRATVDSALRLACLVVQSAVTAAIMASVQPWLLLLPLFSLVPTLLGRRAEGLLDAARQSSAPVARAIRHLRDLAWKADSQKEIRLSGSIDYLIERAESLQRELAGIMGPAQRRYALLRASGQVVFAAAYAASVLLVYREVTTGAAAFGDAVLVIALATQMSWQMTTGMEMLSSVHAASAGLRRLIDLRERATFQGSPGTPVPAGAEAEAASFGTGRGIRFEDVWFTYPGTATPALRGVDLDLPAGRSVALVGVNGAGKSTLIKLLNGLYEPTRGRVLVNGVDLATVNVAAWRSRTAALFQDFARLDFTLQESVGVGHLADIGSVDAVLSAIERARAVPLLERLPNGTRTLLGKGYGDGTDLSGGQWQSVGFARTMMRTDPLLLCLDEPGHALDPISEQRMCDAYQATAKELAFQVGGVTVFVTHRLSTVRLADVIVVMNDGVVAEMGTHTELMDREGLYAEMFALQSRAYS